ncbi:MAG: hypothetical protein WKF75_01560 [Singulisphaera sp.]
MAGVTVAYVLAAYAVARGGGSRRPGAFAAALLVAALPTTLFLERPLLLGGAVRAGGTGVPGRQPGGVPLAERGGGGAPASRATCCGHSAGAARGVGAGGRGAPAASRAAFRAAVAAVPVVAWQGYISHVRHAPDYARPAYAYQRAPYLMYNVSYAENLSLLDPFDPAKGPATLPRVARRTLVNLLLLPASLGEAVSAQEGYWRMMLDVARPLIGRSPGRLARPATLALGGLVLVGVGVLARREWLVVLFGRGGRDNLPLRGPAVRPLPLAAGTTAGGGLVLGMGAVHNFLMRRGVLGRAATAGAVALVIGQGLCIAHAVYLMDRVDAGYARYVDRLGVSRPYRLFYYDEKWSRYDAALAWLKQAADAGDVVATTAPHWTYLTTGLKAVQPPYDSDPGTAQRLLDSVPAKYVILDTLDDSNGSLSRRFAEPAIRGHPGLWRLAYEGRGGGAGLPPRAGMGRR